MLGKNGDQCNVAADCSSNTCDTSLSPPRCGKPTNFLCSESFECSTLSCGSSEGGSGQVCGKGNNIECSTNSECMSKYCRLDTTSNKKSCAKADLSIGETCLGDDVCASKSCDTTASPPICVPPATPCFSNSACSGGTFCDLFEFQCVSPKKNGEMCNLDSQCISKSCDQNVGRCGTPSGFLCFNDSQCSTNVCDKGALSQAKCGQADGSTCFKDAECSALNCRAFEDNSKRCTRKDLSIGDTCVGDDICFSRYCGPDKKCAFLNREIGATCAVDKECTSGRCTLQASDPVCAAALKDDGATCDGNDVCKSAYCSGQNKCAALNRENGVACTENRECRSTACSTDSTTSICVPSASSCTVDTSCDSGFYCDLREYYCIARLPNGAPCTANNGCSSGSCNTSGRCADPKLQDGAVCTSGDQCESNTCSRSNDAPQSAPFTCKRF